MISVDNCAREPIHIPGAIQPHGALIAVSPGDFKIIQASLNVASFFGKTTDELIGLPLNQFLPSLEAQRFASKFAELGFSEENPFKINFAIRDKVVSFDLIAHRESSGVIILEFEPAPHSESATFSTIYKRINSTVTLVERAKNLADLSMNAARALKALTGFHRVMIYKFDAEWNGNVIAEAKEPGQAPFLDLWYPASDIPAQARALYRTNWLRLIPDVNYQASPLLSARDHVDKPLDLSYSVLRSVSPIHLQYLKNMGVGASMSVSIMKEGELWGLIAFHHNEPRYLPYELRQGLEFIGKLFSLQLAVKDRFENADYKKKLKALQPILFEKMKSERHFLAGLYRGKPDLLTFAEGAQGAAVCYRDDVALIGETPSEADVRALYLWLKKEKSKVTVFHTRHLAREYPAGERIKKKASGILALTIPEPDPSFVIWFKPEVAHTVSWAGQPEKAVEVTDGQTKLSPRSSFELWRQNVTSTSLPWAAEEIDAAEELRRSIIEVDLERQVGSALKSNRELDLFTQVAAHDLKVPLRGIAGFAQFLTDDLKGKLDPESETNLRDIGELAHKTQALINNLYEYSKLGRVDFSFDEVDLNTVLTDVFQILRADLDAAHVRLIIDKKLPRIFCDRVRIGQVFMNLVLNAVKYNDKTGKRVEVGFTGSGQDNYRFFVRDNGIGIAPGDETRIFDMFERLHPPEAFGGGSGMGLAIVKQIVEKHGGSLSVESKVGEGTTFYFTLTPQRGINQ